MFSNFYQVLDLHNKICVALANLQWNICKKGIEDRTSPYFSYGYQKWILVDSLFGYMGLPNCVHYWV